MRPGCRAEVRVEGYPVAGSRVRRRSTLAARLCERPNLLASLAVSFALCATAPHALEAQAFRGSTASTLGGVALGAYSGSVMGLVGSVLPCNRTIYGSKCAATGASVGGALGVAMGGLIGAQNQDETVVRLRGAGIGAVLGSGVGLVLRRTVRQSGWEDVVTVAMIGSAFGATPVGSGIGLGAGSFVGGLVWLTFPRAGLPDFLLFSLAGAAVGGMVDWADGAANAKRRGSGPRIPLMFSIPSGL